MQILTLLMIVAVTTFDYLAKGDYWGRGSVLPGGSQYLPELLSVAALLAVVVLGVRSRFRDVQPKYWIIFAALLLVIGCGIASQRCCGRTRLCWYAQLSPSHPVVPVAAGIRFTDDHVRTQFRLLLLIGFIQIPLAFDQYFLTVSKGFSFTGDWVAGTIGLSHTLSIFMLCAVSVAAGLAARRIIRPLHFLLIFLLLLLPTTINETKATFFLLPLGLSLAFLSAADPRRRLRMVAAAVAVVALFLVVFVPSYDYVRKDRPYSAPLTEMLTDSQRMEGYLWTKEGVGTVSEVGRGAAVVVAWQQVVSDPTTLAFGFGIGNVSDSALGHGFVGRHFNTLGPFAKISFSLILLELGLIGLLLVLSLMWMVALDSRVVARRAEGQAGALAAGWVGVTAIMVASTLYMPVVAQTSLSYLYWFYSGIVVAQRTRLPIALRGRQA